MDPVLQKGLDAVLQRINQTTGLADQNDMAAAVEMFKRLAAAGHIAEHIDEVYSYVQESGATETTIHDIGIAYEAATSDPRDNWSDDLIEALRNEAGV